MNQLQNISYNISTYKLKPEETVKVEVGFELVNNQEVLPDIWAEITYKGETVIRDTYSFADDHNLSEKCNSYRYIFELTPPFNAPNGLCEVRIGAKNALFDNGKDHIVADKILIGEQDQPAIPYKASINCVLMPEIIRKNEQIEIKASVSVEPTADFDIIPYLSLWKGELLYDVLEAKEILSRQNSTVHFSVALKGDMPEGEYSARVGVHRVNSDISEIKTVSVVGSDIQRSQYHKPLSYGKYFVRNTGKEQFWYVNQSGTLIWNGEPYIPFGGMFVSSYLRAYDPNNPEKNKAHFEQDKADLEELKAAGIEDLYIGGNIMRVTPIWVYKYLTDYLEKNGWKYGIQGDTRDKRKGSLYYLRATEKSKQFKIEKVTKSGHVELVVSTDFASAFDYEKNAIYAVIDDTTGELVDCGVSAMSKASEKQVLMSADIKLPGNNTHTVYFTPEVYQDMRDISNYWDDPSGTYNFTEKVFSRLPTGDNFRFVVDLLSNESGVYNKFEQGRFSDDGFNKIFSEWLENKYKSISALNDAWSAHTKISSFIEAAELIPIYTSGKDDKNNSYSYFVNMHTGKGYKLDVHKGVAWNDYLDARDELFLDFMNKACDTAKRELDVPCVFKHVSVQRKYFINKNKVGGFDGVGSEAYESIDSVANKYVITSAHNNQFARTAWSLVTETNNHENVINKYNSGQWSYESKEDMFARFNIALDLGMKGIFDFLLADRVDMGGKLGQAYSWVANKHVIGWASEYAKILHNRELIEELTGKKYKNEMYYYYPPNKSWWMKPNERGIVQLEDDCYPFKRLKTKKGIHVLSTEDLNVDTKLIFINLNDSPYSKVFGPKLSEFINENHKDKRICVLGHRNDIGTIPEIDRYFTDEKQIISNDEGEEIVQILSPTPTSTVLKSTDGGKPWAIKDGNLYIIATNHIENADGEFGTLCYVDELGVTTFDI